MSEEKNEHAGLNENLEHMQEEAESRVVPLPLLIQDAKDGKWKAFLKAEEPAIVADTEEEFNQKLLEAGLTPERIQELRQEWETSAAAFNDPLNFGDMSDIKPLEYLPIGRGLTKPEFTMLEDSDMVHYGGVRKDPSEQQDVAQVGIGVEAFCEQILSKGNFVDMSDEDTVHANTGVKMVNFPQGIFDRPEMKVIPQPTSQSELDQGYSWKLKMEIDPNEGKVVQAENVGDGWGSELPPEQQTPTVQPGIPEDKLREVTVPFPADKIREYFSDKSLFFIANYSDSKLKGAGFLTYLSNINIPSDVKFNTPISYEEYAEIMKAYMESINIVNCAGLHVMAAEMLLVAKGLPYVCSPYALPIDESIIQKFIEEHRPMVEKWLHFIDSTQVYALRSIKVLNEHFKPKEVFPIVEDRGYVGCNIAQLYRIPEFIAIYFSIENATYKLSYFQEQFESYMFKNETLSKYFNSPNNFAALYFMHYASGLFKPEDIVQGLFKIGVFDPKSKYFVKEAYAATIQI